MWQNVSTHEENRDNGGHYITNIVVGLKTLMRGHSCYVEPASAYYDVTVWSERADFIQKESNPSDHCRFDAGPDHRVISPDRCSAGSSGDTTFFVDCYRSFVKENTSYLQDLGDYCTSKKGIDGKHQPTPRNSDLQCHLKQSILIKVIVAIRSKMLGICRPAQH